VIDDLELMRRRFGDERPGLQLMDIEAAAIPVTIVQADVLAQERKPLPILEEFVVRFVAAGVGSTDEIGRLLGLSDDQVLESAAIQISANNLRRRDATDQLALTPQGLEVARDLAATRPVLRRLPIPFDRLAWEIVDYPKFSLITKKDAQERGLRLLPATQTSRIGLDDVTAARFNDLLRARPAQERRIEILQVRKVSANTHRYLPAHLLVYGEPARGELELGVCVEGELRPDLGMALEKINAVERLGLSIGAPAERPRLDPELESQRVEVDSLVADDVGDDAAASPPPVADLPVRSVSVFEHPQLLNEALETAQRRLLIISPWVRSAVVNTDFLAKLQRRLRAGVAVTIAHGIGDDDSGSDADAIRRLGNLAIRFKDLLTVTRVRNTHAKVLVFDDKWISTSFNWLSFRGDPERTYRMEEGTLVQIPAKVDEEYAKYVALIRDQRS
jgi:hypothetical protein